MLWATVHRCLQHKAPQYIKDCCVHMSDIVLQQHLWSAGCRQLLVLLRSMFGRLAFSLAGLAAWNSFYQTTFKI